MVYLNTVNFSYKILTSSTLTFKTNSRKVDAIRFILFVTNVSSCDVTLNKREKYLLFDWCLLGCSRWVSSDDEKEGY